MKRRNFLIGAGLLGAHPTLSALANAFGSNDSKGAAGTVVLYSGIPIFDELKSGFHPGELTLIAARPSVGKTSFAVALANNFVARLNDSGKLHFYSVEMAKEQLIYRLLANRSNLSLRKIRIGSLNDDEIKALMRLAAGFADEPLHINDTAKISPENIRNQLVVSGQANVGAVIIDYLQLMTVDKRQRSRAEELQTILRELKSIAVEFNIPVIALSQLNRNEVPKATKDIDSYIVITADSYSASDVCPEANLMRFCILANRFGDIGSVNCNWNRETLRIG